MTVAWSDWYVSLPDCRRDNAAVIAAVAERSAAGSRTAVTGPGPASPAEEVLHQAGWDIHETVDRAAVATRIAAMAAATGPDRTVVVCALDRTLAGLFEELHSRQVDVRLLIPSMLDRIRVDDPATLATFAVDGPPVGALHTPARFDLHYRLDRALRGEPAAPLDAVLAALSDDADPEMAAHIDADLILSHPRYTITTVDGIRTVARRGSLPR